MPTLTKIELTIAGRSLTISTGELARQAGGSVVVQYGETVVLGTATMGKPFQEDRNFMPLLVEYEEKFYAAGKIKGSRFIKREGRPTDDAIVNARLIDRSIRPLFQENMINDVQVVTTVLSYDGQNDPAILAVIAASAALTISDVPWDGPLAAVRVGMKDGQLVINPPAAEREQNPLDVVISGTSNQVVMLEADGQEAKEEDILQAITEGQTVLRDINKALFDLQKKVGKAKQIPIFFQFDTSKVGLLEARVKPILTKKLKKAKSKEEIGQAERDTVAEILLTLNEQEKERLTEHDVRYAIHEIHGSLQREMILQDGWRADQRKLDEIRPLSVKVALLPRTHGSGLFQRGETQVLTTLTLGGPSDVQLIDTMEIEAKKRYIHYYNFPAYSVGEIKPSRGPGRREIGHGALAERALIPVLPDKENWPYTMLVVSEVLESHGSSSMASACGSTMALMDGGVPIKRPVAGIAIGLMTDTQGNYRILTDIAGIEDEKGDMDLKVAGTSEGVTALQMDIKLGGITHNMLRDALEAAKKARLQILEQMAKVLAEPRAELSQYAPRIETMRIPVDKIGDLIGPKGKHITEIIDATGVEIDVEDDGLVSITSQSSEAMQKAKEWIHNLTREIKPGERFEGKVTRIMDFGAFVEIVPRVEGMVHVSQFKEEHVNNIHDVVKVGDVIPVVVTEIDAMGRINLSHLAAVNPNASTHRPSRSAGRPPRGDRPRRPSRPRPPRR